MFNHACTCPVPIIAIVIRSCLQDVVTEIPPVHKNVDNIGLCSFYTWSYSPNEISLSPTTSNWIYLSIELQQRPSVPFCQQ